jgi:hypothetical protein
VTRPRDIYKHTNRADIETWCREQGMKVIGFRPPQPGDLVIGSRFSMNEYRREGGDWPLIRGESAIYRYGNCNERLIVERIV